MGLRLSVRALSRIPRTPTVRGAFRNSGAGIPESGAGNAIGCCTSASRPILINLGFSEWYELWLRRWVVGEARKNFPEPGLELDAGCYNPAPDSATRRPETGAGLQTVLKVDVRFRLPVSLKPNFVQF